MRKYRARKKAEEQGLDPDELEDEELQAGEATRGRVYGELQKKGLADPLLDSRVTHKEAAGMLGVDKSAVTKAVKALKIDQRLEKEQEKWEKPETPPMELEYLDALLDNFRDYRTENFVTPFGEPYQTPPHQSKWARAIIRNIIIGGRLMVLSPPRHGKTELVAHLQCWLITCVNINIRLLNVGGNEDISSNSSGLTKQMLEENENLEKYIPVGHEYRPKRNSGLSWTASKFTVAPRTNPSVKSPTMVAVGRGGKILSRDADVIVVDDLEDHDSTWTETNREKTRNWWETTVMSREEAHTAVIIIGSRQHPDDIYQHILEDQAWETIVETAHDEATCDVEVPEGATLWKCDCDPVELRKHAYEGHREDCHFRQHTAQHEGGCMLWPEMRDFHWLSRKRGPNFPMVYLNEPVSHTVSVFTRELFDGCKDGRKTGEVPDSGFHRLIAGLDPAGSGHQAVFLWALNPRTNERYAIDFENEKGGGIRKAREQVREWYEKYGVQHWVIEKNLYHGGIVEDELLSLYCSKNSIRLEPHQTGINKWDDELGVSVLADWMERNRLWIPWGDHMTASKWKDYRRQLISFSRERRRNRRSDIVMASWFPEWRMQQWRKDFLAVDSNTDDTSRRYPFEPMSTVYERVFA